VVSGEKKEEKVQRKVKAEKDVEEKKAAATGQASKEL